MSESDKAVVRACLEQIELGMTDAQGRPMSESDKAVVRACLEQIELGMTEAREVKAWWAFLSEDHRTEWKDFAVLVSACRLFFLESWHT